MYQQIKNPVTIRSYLSAYQSIRQQVERVAGACLPRVTGLQWMEQ